MIKEMICKRSGKAIPGEENLKCEGLKRPVGKIASVCPGVQGVGHRRRAGDKGSRHRSQPSEPCQALAVIQSERKSLKRGAQGDEAL